MSPLHNLPTKAPKPTGKATPHHPTKAPKPTGHGTHHTGSGKNTDPTTDNGGLLHSLGHFLWTHPIAIPILTIAALIGIQYAWKQWRNKQALRGVAVRPLGAITKDVLRFMTKEDKRPLHKKTPDWLTGTRLYAILTILGILSITPGLPTIPPAFPLLILLITVWARSSKIFKARRATVNQMFAVATGECRYPKGAELNPWNYINVTNWQNLTQPGQTVVTIPAAYQSEDMKTREKFERQFNGTVSEENAWTYKWESAKNRIICEPAAFLPGMAPYPGPGPKWDEIPVGVKGDGTQAIIPLTVTPHTLVCGPTGSGKSVLQRSVLFHVLAHSDTWRIVAIDMKKVEMAWLKKYPSVLKVATDLEDAVEVLRSLRSEMMRRYEEMEQMGVNHAKDLPDPPKAIFCMIDESTVLLAPEGIKSDEGKERDALHAEAGMIIGELGRLSRASMIHVMACFQRPDATFLRGETKANFDARIAAGRMDTTPSLMVLDSEAANRLPKIKGRGMIRIGGELDTFQGFFAEQSWFDEWLAQQEAGAAGPVVDGEVIEPSGSEETPKRRLGRPSRSRKAEPSEDQALGDGGSPVPAEAGEPGAPGKRGGLKGLAAKAAAKAEARAARMDAEAGGEPASVPEPVVAPVPVAGGEDFDAEAAVDLGSYLAPPSFDDADFEDEEFDEDFPEDEYDVEEYPDEDAILSGDEDGFDEEPVAEPVPDRPGVPQPVQKPVGVYQPGAPLPNFLSPGKQPPSQPVPPAPPAAGGLPVQPPRLPTRPPTSH